MRPPLAALLLLTLAMAGCGARPAGLPALAYRSPLLEHRWVPAAAAAGSGGSAGAPVGGGAARRSAADSPHTAATLRERVVAQGQRLVGQGSKDADFIWRAYAEAGVPLRSQGGGRDAAALHRVARARGAHLRGPKTPLPGDLAFFRLSASNRRQPRQQPVDHVALVERLDPDGTVHLLHQRHGKVQRMVAQPGRPHLRRQGAKVVNTYLVPARKDDGPNSPHLAGEVLAGFATLLR